MVLNISIFFPFNIALCMLFAATHSSENQVCSSLIDVSFYSLDYWVDSLQCGPLSPPFSPINSKIEKIVRSLKLEKNVVQPRRLELDEKIGEGEPKNEDK
jgi:hypothetical protein